MSEITNPQDAELEEVVLGACLLESKAITLVADILRPEVFYTETNREIYAVLQGMYHAGQVIDIMTIKEKFARRGKNSQSVGLKLPKCRETHVLIPLFIGVSAKVIEHITDDAYNINSRQNP